MKITMYVICLTLCLGCAQPKSSGGASATNPSNPTSPAATPTPVPTHVYSMKITALNGNNATYYVSMAVNFTDPDVQTIGTGTVGPIVNPTVVTYNLTGRYLRQVQIGKQNDTAPEGGITGQLYRDGVLVQTSSTLTTGTTFQIFNDLD